VAHIQGFGRIASPNEVAVDKPDGSREQVKTKNILIATGSEVTPFPGIDVSWIDSSRSSSSSSGFIILHSSEMSLHFKILHYNIMWFGGQMVRMLDLRSAGRGLKSWPACCRVQPLASC